ncbi:MAG: Hsp20 family protein [Gammaproteobacteria bacterium]|jgi:molecular chaperone IbpA
MKTIDLTPLYRNSIGFDRLVPMLEGAFRSEPSSVGYPPYNIEMVDDNHYAIALAVAGFNENELDIQVERGVLTVRGEKSDDNSDRNYLYQGIATRTFERKFNLAEFVEVTGARLENGLLNISLVREIPEQMRPKRIEIHSDTATLEHDSKSEEAA